MRLRKLSSPASKTLRKSALVVKACWYAMCAWVRWCICSMKAVADLVNLSTASLYIAMVVGVGCGLTLSSSFFHMVSLLWSAHFLSRYEKALDGGGAHRYVVRAAARSRNAPFVVERKTQAERRMAWVLLIQEASLEATWGTSPTIKKFVCRL